jgi:hypothetical protein
VPPSSEEFVVLSIKADQMQSLSEAHQRRVDRDLGDYLKLRFPTVFEGRSDEEVQDLSRRVRSVAKAYGIEKENDVATFGDLSVMYGEDFHLQPWASDVLACDALHGPDKMTLLRLRVEETGVDLKS